MGASDESTRQRTRYLDGMRGCAALYVAVHHVVDFFVVRARARGDPPWWVDWAGVFCFGRFSVATFIVLSGYVLTKPLVERDTLVLRDGVTGFLGRRARRILPPYYAALALSLAAIAVVPALRSPATPMWAGELPVTGAGIASHLLLIHNLQPTWIYRINAPLWSIATEWQIYLLFALVLRPLWRRAQVALFAAAVALAALPVLVFDSRFLLGSPWFVLLFASGMGAAYISFSPRPSAARARRGPWGLLAAAFGSLLAVLCGTAWWVERPWAASEMLVGLTVATLLVACTGPRPRRGGAAVLTSLLEARPLLWLGTCSYSIYLVHQPVLSAIAGGLHGSTDGRLMVGTLVVGIPTVLLVGYGFHRVFERPFLSERMKRAHRRELAHTTGLRRGPARR